MFYVLVHVVRNAYFGNLLCLPIYIFFIHITRLVLLLISAYLLSFRFSLFSEYD